MKYSIIIAIYNRKNEAIELLQSLENLDFDVNNFEIIFSDDGSTDKLKEYLEEYKSTSKLQINYLFQQNKGPGEARNHAMKHAKGNYFIFVDSDCILPSRWLKSIDDAIKIEKFDCFGGPDTAHDSFSDLQKAINYSMTSFIGTGGTRTGKGNVQKKYYPRSYNMGISKEIFDKIGGMGTLRHGQDMEFSARIYKHGFKVGVIPDAFVYHKRRTSLKRFFKQIFNWGVTRINLGEIDSNMLKPIHYLPLLILIATIVAIFAPLIFDFLYFFWVLLLICIISLSAIAFFESFIKYKKLKTSLLSVITLFIQIYAYGFGFLYGKIQFLSGKKIAKGFTKNYYK